MKKNCLLFLFDGFSDTETGHITVGLSKSDQYTLKTIAMEKKVIRSMGGMSVIPDTDFIPLVDLDDIDSDTTAMLILPGGIELNKRSGVLPLIRHCIDNGIPVANYALTGYSPMEFARSVFDLLDLGREEGVRTWVSMFERELTLSH